MRHEVDRAGSSGARRSRSRCRNPPAQGRCPAPSWHRAARAPWFSPPEPLPGSATIIRDAMPGTRPRCAASTDSHSRSRKVARPIGRTMRASGRGREGVAREFQPAAHPPEARCRHRAGQALNRHARDGGLHPRKRGREVMRVDDRARAPARAVARSARRIMSIGSAERSEAPADHRIVRCLHGSRPGLRRTCVRRGAGGGKRRGRDPARRRRRDGCATRVRCQQSRKLVQGVRSIGGRTGREREGKARRRQGHDVVAAPHHRARPPHDLADIRTVFADLADDQRDAVRKSQRIRDVVLQPAEERGALVGAPGQQIPVLRLRIGTQAAADKTGAFVGAGDAAAGILHDDGAVGAQAQRVAALETLAGSKRVRREALRPPARSGPGRQRRSSEVRLARDPAPRRHSAQRSGRRWKDPRCT